MVCYAGKSGSIPYSQNLYSFYCMLYTTLTAIKMTGNLEDAYVARETPMIFYLNIHTALEQLRANAEASGQSGPRVNSIFLYLISFLSVFEF